eukprot:scaffold41942_cov76-Phaeocystis_antarctica.AAC.12
MAQLHQAGLEGLLLILDRLARRPAHDRVDEVLRLLVQRTPDHDLRISLGLVQRGVQPLEQACRVESREAAWGRTEHLDHRTLLSLGQVEAQRPLVVVRLVAGRGAARQQLLAHGVGTLPRHKL